jgi:hypothetical protein
MGGNLRKDMGFRLPVVRARYASDDGVPGTYSSFFVARTFLPR